jgi:hypothetical protein
MIASVHREFVLAYASVWLLGLAVLATLIWRDQYAQAVEGTLLLLTGGFLLAFGFWGADYAFSVRIGELNQSGQEGRVKGEAGKVYVPFLGNYTPVEWWNLNWFFVTMGALCMAVGALLMGLVLGRLGI